jgi:hypothetical protein
MLKVEAKQRLYEWLMQPKMERQPPSKKALCRELGISVPTTRAWEKEFVDGRKDSDLQRVVALEDSLFKAAMGGNVRAAELYAKMKGMLIDRNETKVSVELNADQLDKARRAAEERVRAELDRINCGVVSLPAEPPVLLQ